MYSLFLQLPGTGMCRKSTIHKETMHTEITMMYPKIIIRNNNTLSSYLQVWVRNNNANDAVTATAMVVRTTPLTTTTTSRRSSSQTSITSTLSMLLSLLKQPRNNELPQQKFCYGEAFDKINRDASFQTITTTADTIYMTTTTTSTGNFPTKNKSCFVSFQLQSHHQPQLRFISSLSTNKKIKKVTESGSNSAGSSFTSSISCRTICTTANSKSSTSMFSTSNVCDEKVSVNAKKTAIVEQKERAKQFWNESNYNEDMKAQVNNVVMENLEQGLVLPIFHTLCRHPNKRLFPTKTFVGKNDDSCSDVIQLSSEPVTMGKCKQNREIVGNINGNREKSYIPSFFTNGNANFEVEDSNFCWEFNDDYTEIVTDLVNVPAQMVGEDIEITKLTRPFDVDIGNGSNLITRRLSRGVIADCFDLSGRKPGTTYAVAGSPGIGKSWTLIYALQQALLFDNACVLFCFQTDGIAIVCIRRQGTVYVWQSKNLLWKTGCDSKLFFNSNVLVLLDPKESKNGGAEYAGGQRMLIMAASNNDKHFVSSVKKMFTLERILSVYTEKELEVVIPYMIENYKLNVVDMDRILERAKIVGPLPRYIISEEGFAHRQKETVAAIKKLQSVDKEDILSYDGVTKNDNTVPGCIFAVNVRLASNVKFHAAKADKDKLQNEDQGHIVGYDGQCISNYFEREVSVMSESVLSAIAQSSRKDLLSFWGVDEHGLSEMGHLVENLFWDDLQSKRAMYVFQMPKHADKDQGGKLSIGNCTFIEGVRIHELGTKVFSAQSSTVARMEKNSPLIDFAGPKFQVYQVTVSTNRSLSISGLKALFLASGHCVTKDGTIEKAKNADEIGQIKLYWVIPPNRADNWNRKKPKTILEKTDALLKECLDTYVDQYILVMDSST